jgi:hypothetical protein
MMCWWQESSVRLATRLRAGQPKFEPHQGARAFLFSTASSILWNTTVHCRVYKSPPLSHSLFRLPRRSVKCSTSSSPTTRVCVCVCVKRNHRETVYFVFCVKCRWSNVGRPQSPIFGWSGLTWAIRNPYFFSHFTDSLLSCRIKSRTFAIDSRRFCWLKGVRNNRYFLGIFAPL